ncbi:putative dynamin stalk domain, GTPase effector domain, Dynamin superfamily [Helianthus annuus]|nr:putative dynamin stalk domain, GTPase effector domain, Dynamin superfamily [Helianthus annuus]
MATFIKIVGSLKETLQKILIQGEIDEYENDKQMHCDTRLVEMLDKLSKDLQASEVKGIRLPHFIPHSLFLRLLKKKVNSVSELPINFVNDVWGYLETVCAKVLIDQCGNYPKLLPSIKKATEHVVSKMKAKFVERVVEMIEMEKITDYTCDPGFIISYNKPMNYHAQFSNLLTSYMSNSINVEGYGSINIGHLREVPENTRNQAFDLKIMMTSYWKIVLKRMVDCLALQLRFFIQKVVNKEIEIEIVSEVMGGGGIEKMLNEPPSTSKKRERLHTTLPCSKNQRKQWNKSWMVLWFHLIKLLQEATIKLGLSTMCNKY